MVHNKILHYSTTVSDATEICFIIIRNNFTVAVFFKKLSFGKYTHTFIHVMNIVCGTYTLSHHTTWRKPKQASKASESQK